MFKYRLETRIGTSLASPFVAWRQAVPSPKKLARIRMATAVTPGEVAIAPSSKAFTALSEKLKEIQAFSGISGLLGWDEMVMMPAGAAGSRGAQKSALAGLLHERKSDPAIGELLEQLQREEGQGADAFRAAAVREAAREYRKVTAVTKDLAKREAEHETEAYQTWVKARQASNFSLFAPALEKWVALRRERAALIDPGKPVYDVLLDDYQPGLTSARLDSIFDQVKAGLVPLLADLRARGTPPDTAWLKGEFDTDAQAALCREIALTLGFDLEKGRLDVSVHPFTGGAHPTDVRMTTRFKKDSLLEGLTGTVHETGHALYEQGRNLEYDGLPVNEAAGMGVHESQSLLWERMVGLGRPFAAYLLPKIKAAFPQLPQDRTAEDLYRAVNEVLPRSLIRVEADEVTYPLHIILRYELESELVRGDISVDQLPELWNKKMKEYLGVEPESDAQGVLQDVHWSYGLFGYFPTYSLGAMMAAQIFEAARKDLPDFEAEAAAGNFSKLKAWLNKNIHQVGSLYPSADELLEKVTGSPLDPSILLEHLKSKYSELYGL
ncbi:hypothetical protein ACKKBG_A26530 [Auxenochlorella protothecoides x Auxenochlorella symbiontica]